MPTFSSFGSNVAMPVLKKKVLLVPKNDQEDKKTEELVTENVEVKEEVVQKETASEKSVTETTEEISTTETEPVSEVEVNSETTDLEKTLAETKKEESKEVEKPVTTKKKRGPKSKKEKQAMQEMNQESIPTPNKAVSMIVDDTVDDKAEYITSYEEALNAVFPKMIDEKWESLKQELTEELLAIKIDPDINASGILHATSQLDKLKNRITYEQQSVKSVYDRLAGKEVDGAIKREKRLKGKGTNAEERERSGILACQSYELTDGKKVNLFELFDTVNERYCFFNSIFEGIKFKKDLLITANAALKLEKELL